MSTAARLHHEGQTATADMRPVEGARLLRAALRELDATSSAEADLLRGRILISLAYAEADQGNVEQGRQLLGEAEKLLPPNQRGTLYGQRGLFLSRIGNNEAAIEQYDAAIAVLREDAEPEELARALLNRGNLHMSNADAQAARADLHRCIDVATGHGFARIVPIANHSLGYLDYLAGDLPAALGVYGSVARQYAVVKPGLLPVLALDRGRALIAAGLFREADRELASALAQFESQKLGQDYAEALLARAEVALLADDPVAARVWARRARARFLRRGNDRWAALASLLALKAELVTKKTPLTIAQRLRVLADSLRQCGLGQDGRLASLLAARCLVAAGLCGEASQEAAAAGRPRRADRLDIRLMWRLTLADVAEAQGRWGEAAAHLRHGLAEVQRHRSQLGGLDLQTGIAVHARELSNAGLRVALRVGSVAGIYHWSERARAQALLLPAVRPPENAEAAQAMEQLRQISAAIRQAELSGRSATALRARREALQRNVREQSWTIAGPGTTTAPASYAAVKAELAGAAMVIYLRNGPGLSALVIAGQSAVHVPLGKYAFVQEALRRLRADLDAAAGRAMPDRLARALANATKRDAALLAGALLDPLLHLIGDRDLVIVPTGLLITTPWAVLPGCAGRPLTVAPSATSWITGRSRLRSSARDSERTLLVAGPGNHRSEPEVRAIAAMRPAATTLTGDAATVAASLAGMDGASVTHVAAHGHHVADNPLFSALELADGSMMGYDLQRLAVAPTMVVLSSCDLGLSAVRPGDETLGMVTVLLNYGTATVVASVSHVADETAMSVMTGFHTALLRGVTPSAALAGASSPATGFVCFGSG